MKTVLLALFFASFSWAQTSSMLAPDCSVYLNVTAVGTSQNIDNRTKACSSWTMVYSTSANTSTVSIEIDGAPDNAGAPGTFVVFPGTAITGSIISTALNTSDIKIVGYQPWVRINVTALTGVSPSVSATLLGWRNPPHSLNYALCDQVAPISISAPTGASTSTLITGSANKSIRACFVQFSAQSAIGFGFVAGATGSSCATSPVTLSGTFPNVITFTSTPGPEASVTVPSGDDLCMSITNSGGGSVSVGGWITYSSH